MVFITVAIFPSLLLAFSDSGRYSHTILLLQALAVVLISTFQSRYDRILHYKLVWLLITDVFEGNMDPDDSVGAPDGSQLADNQHGIGQYIETGNSNFKSPVASRESSNIDQNQKNELKNSPEPQTTLEPLGNGKREATNVQIGKRSATLFLSSHSLKLSSKPKAGVTAKKPSTEGKIPPPSRTSSNISQSSSQRKQTIKNSVHPDELSQLRVKKEFTFTGYDIMADVEPVPVIPEEEQVSHEIRKAYTESCKQIGVIPVRSLIPQLCSPVVQLRCRSLGPKGADALAIALVNNPTVTSLDLEDNGIGAEGAKSLAEMLDVNHNITDVSLAENLISKDGLSAITDMMKNNFYIQSLDLTGSGFVDSDSYIVADLLENNKILRELVLSHNQFGDKGGYLIAQALALNDTLRIIDLSWNHIRGEGAKSIAACLQKNIGLRKMDISWNGFTTADCMIFGVTLKDNTTLKELDISNNQLGENAIAYLMKGIQKNDGLEILRIGGNLIIPKMAIVILKTIEQSETCRVHTLDMGDTEVDEEFYTIADEMQAKGSFEVAHGPVIKRRDLKANSAGAIDGNMDAVYELFKYMSDNNYRVIDLMKWLDKDNSMSISRDEFKKGMITAEVPLTEHQLDILLDKLDADGDGEVDFKQLERLLENCC
ncbi:leucine-rich repeat-containing protein 74A-like isoform X2 [Pecten maximus]|uniref:leucine-rich repeat-containing protein 74A-like isoform X2 n=1 Tax=Pecten maximus TaxID=6579 RepID=UPI0014583927|nr:leucine-rich repeat-containing protein 74A-like isoform X2 [Pecten maximus]